MNQKKNNLFTLAIMGLSFNMYAQDAVPAGGGDASGSGGSASFTVGQVAYTTNNGPNGSSTQGVQQPYEISVVTAVQTGSGIGLFCSVYPNPVTEYIILKVENYKLEGLSFQLYDVGGKLLLNDKIVSKETGLSMGDYSSASYLLKVMDHQNEVKTFKIIKN